MAEQEQQTAPAGTAQPAWKKVVAVIIDLGFTSYVFTKLVFILTGQKTTLWVGWQGYTIFFIATILYFYIGYAVWKKSVGLMAISLLKKYTQKS